METNEETVEARRGGFDTDMFIEEDSAEEGRGGVDTDMHVEEGQPSPELVASDDAPTPTTQFNAYAFTKPIDDGAPILYQLLMLM